MYYNPLVVVQLDCFYMNYYKPSKEISLVMPLVVPVSYSLERVLVDRMVVVFLFLGDLDTHWLSIVDEAFVKTILFLFSSIELQEKVRTDCFFSTQPETNWMH